MNRITKETLCYCVILLLASVLTVISYQSVTPLIVALILYILILPIIKISANNEEFSFLNRLLIILFLTQSISAIYAEYFGDQLQLVSDANSFYEMAILEPGYLTLKQISKQHEGSLVI